MPAKLRFSPAALRKRMGKNKPEYVGAALGVSSQAVRAWMAGQYAPDGGNVLQLARLFKCDPEDLYVNDRTRVS